MQIKQNTKYIYLLECIESDGSKFHKIGFTKNKPTKRVKQLQTGNSSTIKILFSYQSNYSTTVEKTLHRRFDHLRYRGEWFELSDEIINDFQNICNSLESNFDYLYNNKI